MRRSATLLLLIFLLASCGTVGGNATVPTASPSTSGFILPTQTPLASHHWHIGDVVKLETWEITLTQAKELPDQAHPTLNALLIGLTMKNITASAQVVQPLAFTLRDQEGKAYNSMRPLPQGYAAIPGPVSEDSQRQGWLGFEVPPDHEQFTLTFVETATVWDIHVFTDAL